MCASLSGDPAHFRVSFTSNGVVELCGGSSFDSLGAAAVCAAGSGPMGIDGAAVFALPRSALCSESLASNENDGGFVLPAIYEASVKSVAFPASVVLVTSFEFSAVEFRESVCFVVVGVDACVAVADGASLPCDGDDPTALSTSASSLADIQFRAEPSRTNKQALIIEIKSPFREESV